jgi:hypothetical protein
MRLSFTHWRSKRLIAQQAAASRKSRRRLLEAGQGLVEVALILPVLLTLILNAVNFGYYFLVALNLSAAPRSGVEYSIQGFETPAQPNPPAAAGSSGTPSSNLASVAYLTYLDVTGALGSAGNATVQVCTMSLGKSAAGKWQCVTCSGYSSACGAPTDSPGGTAYTDPETSFILNRVDITYTLTPLVPGTAFNLVTLAACGSSTCTFHRQATMRYM